MWLYLLAIAFLIIGVGGGIVGGGVFSFVFIPLGLLVLVYAYVSSRATKTAAQAQGDNVIADSGASGRPLPHTMPGEPTTATTSPEALTNERRVHQ